MKRMLLRVPRSVWIAFVGTSLLFVLFPQIDLAVSGLFYTPGVGFEINGAWYERFIYHASELLIAGVTLALIALWGYARLAKRTLPIRLAGKELAFLLLVLALGPGLMINWALKEHWGRARPVDLVEFGGTHAFSPAWILSDQHGHSFCSGHAGATFYLIAVALVVAHRRRRWVSLAVVGGILVGLVRIASGGHFLSDVLVSFFIVLILTLMLRGLVFGEAPAPNPNSEGAAQRGRGTGGVPVVRPRNGIDCALREDGSSRVGG
ncbi:MAG: phosphatase PAP2 family protein [Chromatiaceae bacterium]